MLAETRGEYLDILDNKENIKMISNLSGRLTTKNSLQQLILCQEQISELSVTSEEQSLINKLNSIVKRSYLKTLISETLRLRRVKEREESQKQIYQQTVVMKIFIFWRKNTQKLRQSKAQSDFFREKRLFNLQRQCFNQWADITQKPKLQKSMLMKKYFQIFKIVSCSQISLRLRRIQLQQILLKSRTIEIINKLRVKLDGQRQKYKKALKHWKITTVMKIFECMKGCALKERGQKLRYQKYRLAYLFHQRTLLNRGFTVLKTKINQAVS